MSRRFVNQYSRSPFHITSRCPNREPFPLDLGEVWRITCDYLYLSHIKHELQIHAFVLMPNHFHLIASSLKFPIGDVMREFMTNTSKEINFLAGRMNQNWGGRHYKCELEKQNYFYNAYKYVYQNPVRAGLCECAEDWKYSTLSGLVGRSPLLVPITPDTILFNPDFEASQLEWLNKKISIDNYKNIKKALTRRKFKLPKLNFQRMNNLESELA